jgi:hypothetical protein
MHGATIKINDKNKNKVLYCTCTYSETLPIKSTPFLVHEDNQEYRYIFSDDGTEICKHNVFLYHFNNYQPTYKKMGEGWRRIFYCLTNFPGFDINLL